MMNVVVDWYTNIKGVSANYAVEYICSIFKILESISHNQWGFMEGRHKNFEDPMLISI